MWCVVLFRLLCWGGLLLGWLLAVVSLICGVCFGVGFGLVLVSCLIVV